MWRSIDRDNIKVSSQPVDNTAELVSAALLHFNQQHDLGLGEAGGQTLRPKQSITSTDQQSRKY